MKVMEYKICKYCGELFLTGSNDPNICDQCEENIFVTNLEESLVKCSKCGSSLIIEIQSEFEVEETGEDTRLIPAYECHECGYICQSYQINQRR